MSIIYINAFQFAAAAAYDPDAQDFINRVIAADVAAGNTSGLEVGVQDAYNDFFVGCKADGTFNALKAACIMAGARTLAGALVPLVSTMPAPTNNNFVAGDYDRETGLVGDGSTKYLNSNRANSADPTDSKHLSVYITSGSSGFGQTYIGVDGALMEQVVFFALALLDCTHQLLHSLPILALLAVFSGQADQHYLRLQLDTMVRMKRFRLPPNYQLIQTLLFLRWIILVR